jgi:glucose-1-phosphate cytidylyltransferase
MKCIILAGGKGTRLGNLTKFQPKPLIEVGGRPLIWHIMKIYEHYSINEFIICIGYRGLDLINYFLK